MCVAHGAAGAIGAAFGLEGFGDEGDFGAKLGQHHLQHVVAADQEAVAFNLAGRVAVVDVLDDFNREGLGIEVDFSLPAERVIRSLDRIMEWRGTPGTTRVDNGPEYISGKLMEWAEKQGVTIQHIQPGQPQQNAYIERYNRTVRHEWLDQYIIESIEEAQDFATQWLWTYNNDCPNRGIGGITPAQKLKMAA